MYTVEFSYKKIIGYLLTIFFTIVVLFTALLFLVRFSEKDQVVFNNYNIPSATEIKQNEDKLKILGYVNPKIKHIQDSQCVGSEKTENGSKVIQFLFKENDCVIITMSSDSIFDNVKSNIIPYIILSIILIFISWYNNRFMFYSIKRSLAENVEIMTAMREIVKRLKQEDTDDALLRINYMNNNEIQKLSNHLYILSTIIIKDTKDFTFVNDIYTDIIGHFNIKMLYFLSKNFYIKKLMIQGDYMFAMKQYSAYFTNKLFFLLSLYNTSLLQLLFFTFVYLYFNTILYEIILPGNNPFFDAHYNVLSIADNLGADVDMKVTTVSKIYGEYLQVTGLALFSILFNVVGSYFKESK